MDKKEIAAVWQAYLEVQEGKYKKEGKKLDPVGKEDGDIDNDGDKDSSDEYLAKRRKAIGKAMGKDDKEQKEGKIPPQFMKGKDKKDDDKEDDSEKSDDKEEKGKKPEKGVNPFAKKKDDDKKKEVEESSCGKTRKEEDEGEKEECPKCKGKGCDHCDDKGYHMKEKMKKESTLTDEEILDELTDKDRATIAKRKQMRQNPSTAAKMKKRGSAGQSDRAAAIRGRRMEGAELFSEEELAALEERAETAGATKSEPFMSTSSAGEKKFYADHKKSDKKFEDMEDQSEMDGSNAGKAVKSQSPARRGDNRKGDTAMKTVSKAKGQ
jgi:hypothetical protein